MNEIEKIPKVIHYCWFGRGKKSNKIIKCMKSWHRNLKGYKFIEWNEDNFDINSNQYVKEAYEAKKYAFVSDYVRLYALYNYGGIYMDTDVEVLKSLDRFLIHEAFSGFEDEKHVPTGLMGAAKEHSWIKELLSYYDKKSFYLPNGRDDMTTNTSIITKNCVEHGLVPNGQYQTILNGVVLYPRTYFCPYDYINGASFITNESYTIHHFAKSWLPLHVRLRGEIKRYMSNILGPDVISTMRKLVSKN
ncbi:glycosyltransferase family 32 protein [Oceanobacillus chungangensis]|uniref:Glycosyl transferase n=1 Tax=Oceanobacillus chungangensis TaxID=1229152 RepID=A0A3D8PW84_9BACI|nr:glycosyltransferase [Oceanobacillus chungangensis]RDW20410.1 glycosyl transferase [Oceanobacillus chungangensis]